MSAWFARLKSQASGYIFHGWTFLVFCFVVAPLVLMYAIVGTIARIHTARRQAKK
jgi:hypothetical protein